MNKIIKLIFFLSIIALSGCIAYPSISPVYRFHAKVVYKCNGIKPDGTKLIKGNSIPNIPVHIWYEIYDEEFQFIAGSRRTKRGTYNYYTFTDENGYFTIPLIWRPYWSIKGLFSWTTISQPNIQFITDSYNLDIVDHIMPCPYRMITENYERHLGKFISSHPSPLHWWGDSEKFNKFIKKVKQKKLTNSQTSGGAN